MAYANKKYLIKRNVHVVSYPFFIGAVKMQNCETLKILYIQIEVPYESAMVLNVNKNKLNSKVQKL
jgi:hypothetical protein